VIGYGSAVVKPIGLAPLRYRTTVLNAPGQQVEVLEGDPPAPRAVVRGYYRSDGVLDSPIPTCLNGGFVPRDCSFDQVALLSNSLTIPARTVGTGASRRSYFTTPPTCPRSRLWRASSTFVYGDGTETVTPTQSCEPAPTRISVAPKRTRRLRRTRFRFRATVLLGGRWVALKRATVRLAGRRGKTNSAGRAAIKLRFPARGRRRVRLGLEGYRSATTFIRVIDRRRR
jgi:hypothetical protein